MTSPSARAAVSVTTMAATRAAPTMPTPNRSCPTCSPRNGVIASAICCTVSSGALPPDWPIVAAVTILERAAHHSFRDMGQTCHGVDTIHRSRSKRQADRIAVDQPARKPLRRRVPGYPERVEDHVRPDDRRASKRRPDLRQAISDEAADLQETSRIPQPPQRSNQAPVQRDVVGILRDGLHLPPPVPSARLPVTPLVHREHLAAAEGRAADVRHVATDPKRSAQEGDHESTGRRRPPCCRERAMASATHRSRYASSPSFSTGA